MTEPAPTRHLIHSVVETADGEPLDAARLTDRQRVGVLLQAAALLSHLDHAGWRLRRGWKGARVDAEGLLRSVQTQSLRSRKPVQSLLRELALELFQGETRISGRGQARRAARGLLDSWDQTLTDLAPDHAVEQILDGAPFLWDAAFGSVRKVLAAEHQAGNGSHLWVAGKGRFRHRLMARSTDRLALETLLASSEARRFWDPVAVQDPLELVAQGRWGAAVARWRIDPPAKSEEKREFARALFFLAQFEQARRALTGLRSTEARILRAWCQSRLGNLKAAQRTLHKLESANLRPQELIDAAELAVRTYGNLGQSDRAAHWVERALALEDSELALRARLLAAEAAWDRQEPDEMQRYLELARPCRQQPDLAWRWYHAQGLHAIQESDGPRVVSNLSHALGRHRRQLGRLDAAKLWNDLGYGRALEGDLAGAERAYRHTHRLLAKSEGPRNTTLALYNLAEIRLRRGRLAGVRPLLEKVTAENRQASNLRGMVQDLELWSRYELLRGRPARALEWVDKALAHLDETGLDWRRDVLQVLAARALGWLEDEEQARGRLEESTLQARLVLEQEERPALWALAGDRERALAEVVEGPVAPLWRALLLGETTGEELWSPLEKLEDYRAGRLVLDVELLAPGITPQRWLRRAIASLHRVGATALAERLEVQQVGPWRALERYLRRAERTVDDVPALFAAAGYPEIRLTRSSEGEMVVLVDGIGGDAELAEVEEGSRLILRAPHIDPVLRTLFAVVLQDHRQTPRSERPTVGELMPGIVGESPLLVSALERLSKLAPADIPILIQGETGTGKEVVAKCVHILSERAAAPFVPVNCGALPESLILSELFGHVRGSFSGAVRDRVGIIEMARGGTIFLDEIGDFPPEAQAKLLRFLQEGEVRRVGESLPRHIDVRVVAATHRHLEEMVQAKEFREDLLFRLRVGRIELPPLRDRGHDIFLLAEHFLTKLGRSRELRLTAAAKSKLLGYHWPGNVRELENVLQVAVALAEGDTIGPEHLDLPYTSGGSRMGYHERLEDFRRRLIQDALTACDGSRAEAARRLGISRQALSYLVRKLGL